MEPPIRLSFKQAASRLKGFLIGSDGTSVVVVRFTPHGISHQKEAIEWVRHCADDTPGLGRDALHMAGTVYESYAVDDASERSLKRLVVPSGLMGIALAWICLRSIRAAIAVLVIAGIGQLFAIATVYYTGGHFSAVLIVLPTLVFMLTLSGAVHLMNYYADVAAWHTDHRGSRAMLLGFKPSLLSSVTTALGMAALAMSGLAPIREFGLYSALCLGISTTFLLLSFPFLSDWFCRSRRWPQPRPKDEAAEPDPVLADAAHHPSYISPIARAYVGFMQRHAIAVSLGGFLLMGFSFYGLLHLKSSSKFDAMFPADSPTVRDMHWVEEHVGPIASVEVLLKFPKTGEVEYFDRIQHLDRIAEHLRKQDVIGGVLSAASFTPPLPQSGSLRDVTRRSALRAGLRNALPMLKEQGWVAESESDQVWRITTKVSAL
ncbi:MAG: MMPL family transporter [Pirellulales bacterium]